MTRVVAEAGSTPREYVIACRGIAVGSRRYLARLKRNVNDHRDGEKGRQLTQQP